MARVDDLAEAKLDLTKTVVDAPCGFFLDGRALEAFENHEPD